MKISVLGCGRWGSFLAWYATSIGAEQVISWGRESEPSYQVLANTGRNEYVTLDQRICLTSDLNKAVTSADIIIISISSQAFDSFARELVTCPLGKKSIVLCMKGIEESTGRRLSQVAVDAGIDPMNLAVWVGPGHIQDFTAGVPNCMVIDSANPQLTVALADTFRSNLIRFYYGNDLVGTEVGAATKNILGIVAGMLDGLGLSTLKGALMARGAREVARLIHALGGNEMSAYGLCHLGDYETTLFSQHSHNRRFGQMLVRGEQFDKLAEGVATAHAVNRLAHKLGVDMPITSTLTQLLDGALNPTQALEQLFERQTKSEFYL